MVTSPAAIGKVRAFSVIVPAPNGSLHSTSVEASPLQDTSLTSAAETSALKVADGTSSSTLPEPFKVVVAPVWIDDGCKSSTLAWVLESPQSAHVTARVPASSSNSCFAVLTSRQKSSSPDAVDDVTWVLVFAKLGGMMELTFTSTGMVTSPAEIGKVRAFNVIVPAPNGSLHTTSVEASPLQDTSLTPAAETSALKVADGTSSSTLPDPFKVVVLPVSIDDGTNESTLACVDAEPQSDHVTANVPASATANNVAAAILAMLKLTSKLQNDF